MSQKRKKQENHARKLWAWAQEHRIQALLITIAIVVSLVIRINLSLTTPLYPGNTDPVHYDEVVMGVFDGTPITNVYWPWGYPYFLIPFYAIFGQTFIVAKLVNTVLGLLSAGLVYLLAKKLFNHKVGLVAGLLMLFDPLMTFYTTNVYTEPLFITLTLATLLLMMYQNKKTPWWKTGLMGVMIGYNAMIKPWSLAVVLIVAVWWLLQKNEWKTTLIWSAYLLGGLILILTPWTIANAVNHDAFVPVPSNGPLNFYLGNHEYGTLAFTSNWPDESFAPFANMTALERSAKSTELATDYIFSDFGGFIGRTLDRFFTYWSHPGKDWYQRVVPNMTETLSYLWILWSLALIGLVYSLKEWKKHSANYLFILVMTGVFSLTLYLARFKIPLQPFQHIYAAAAIILIYNIGKQVVRSIR